MSEQNQINDLLPNRRLTDSEVNQLRDSDKFERVNIVSKTNEKIDEIEVELSAGTVKAIYNIAGEWFVDSEPNTENDGELDRYCGQCEDFVEVTRTQDCKQCGAFSVAKSVLKTVPENWKPATRPPAGDTGYYHEYLAVSVGLSIPHSALGGRKEKAVSDENENEDMADEGGKSQYKITVQWPNHIGYSREQIHPDDPISDIEEARTWLSGLLTQLDQEYDPTDITSIGKVFGGAVESTTRESPVVDSELNCSVCGAYLPHYHGSIEKQWYEHHHDMVDGSGHPSPDEYEIGLDRQMESINDCPHCDTTINGAHGFLDHLEEHGYDSSEAHSIFQRF